MINVGYILPRQFELRVFVILVGVYEEASEIKTTDC